MVHGMQVETVSYMEDLQGFVFDESKCVTYKWLSTTLGVSADVSKRMLFQVDVPAFLFLTVSACLCASVQWYAYAYSCVKHTQCHT